MIKLILMKILFVTDLYPIGNEKIAKALYYFVRDWQNLGHKVDVIRANFILNTLIRGRKIIKEQKYTQNGIDIYNLNFHTPFCFDVYKKLPKNFSLKNYDVIISHMPAGALMAQKLLKHEKIKYICAVHASDIKVMQDIKYSLFFARQLKKACISADKIAPRSYVLKNKIENIIPEISNKTFIAYSGLDEELLQIGEQKQFNPENIIITTAGSLIKRKNIDLIIKALAKIQYKNINLKIIGTGKEEKHLKNLAARCKIQDKVTFTGHISRNEVMQELYKSDIFVLTSDNETFGLVYLEAMTAGNIVIAKKNDGIDGILKDGENAFLINPNTNELINCIEKIISLNENERNKIINNAKETAKSYSAKSAAENYIKNIQ